MRAAARTDVQAMLSTIESVNLLTEREYERVKQLAPHDTDVPLDVWASFLTRLLSRPVTEQQAADIIAEYNQRLRDESVS